MIENADYELIDYAPKTQSLLKEVLVGLSKGQKSLPAKLLYDKKGSEIFEEICKLEEYYPTKSEIEILKNHSPEIGVLIGEEALIIEPGSGAGEKIRILLPCLKNIEGYVPIEISREILLRMTAELNDEFRHLKVMPVCGDFTQDFELPLAAESYRGKKVIFFPGSTLGNFTPDEALQFLKSSAQMLGHGGGLLIGVDLKKDSEIFKLAYDDPYGVTSRFNLNLLERLNRDLDANFDLSLFRHLAFYNEKLGRVEMHLVSQIPQSVRVSQTIFSFKEGESIHTESSYKYMPEELCELAAKAKFRIVQYWKDSRDLFAVYYFEKE